MKEQRKAAKRALYARLAEEGQSKGSKRARKRAKSAIKNMKIPHAELNCGNIGCIRCYPELNTPLRERLKALRRAEREAESAKRIATMNDPELRHMQRVAALRRKRWR